MKLRSLFACAAAIALAACSSLTAVRTTTFNDKELTAQTTLTSLRTNTLTLLDAEKITPAFAKSIQQSAKAADEAIATARTVFVTDCPVLASTAPASAPTAAARVCKSSPGSDAQLNATIAGLTALQAYLTAAGAKP